MKFNLSESTVGGEDLGAGAFLSVLEVSLNVWVFSPDSFSAPNWICLDPVLLWTQEPSVLTAQNTQTEVTRVHRLKRTLWVAVWSRDRRTAGLIKLSFCRKSYSVPVGVSRCVHRDR